MVYRFKVEIGSAACATDPGAPLLKRRGWRQTLPACVGWGGDGLVGQELCLALGETSRDSFALGGG
jgi:hypothetical protein